MSAHPQLDRATEAAAEPRDGAVVARVLAGDRNAYRELVERHQAAVYRYALGMVGEPDLAADLVQDGFIKAYAALARCENPDQFGAWVYRIVRNRCLDHLKSRRRKVVPLHSIGELVSPVEGPGEPIEREEIRSAVFTALGQLPEDQREAFLLKHVEERSYDEMCEILGASTSALKMRVKRAREALQARLGDRSL